MMTNAGVRLILTISAMLVPRLIVGAHHRIRSDAAIGLVAELLSQSLWSISIQSIHK